MICHSQYNVQINWKLISKITLGGKRYLLLCCYLLVLFVFKIYGECESMFISGGISSGVAIATAIKVVKEGSMIENSLL